MFGHGMNREHILMDNRRRGAGFAGESLPRHDAGGQFRC